MGGVRFISGSPGAQQAISGFFTS